MRRAACTWQGRKASYNAGESLGNWGAPMMNAQLSRADSLMTQLLLVKPAAEHAGGIAGGERQAENALTASLLFSGARCLLQYALLPFLLPIVGIAADAAIPLLLLINALAMASIFFSLRRFWTILYAHRWRYLLVALTALVLLLAFTIYDIAQLAA